MSILMSILIDQYVLFMNCCLLLDEGACAVNTSDLKLDSGASEGNKYESNVR